MNIKDVIVAVNKMQADGVIESYAIGGAVGATFYLEPIATLDVDIFIALRTRPDQILISMQPVFDYLIQQGYSPENEYITIAGWPVQFLAPPGPLGDDALECSMEFEVDGNAVRVFSAEHLAAIALQTGRAKDKARLLQFLHADEFDRTAFESILNRHHLDDKWRQFQAQSLDELK